MKKNSGTNILNILHDVEDAPIGQPGNSISEILKKGGVTTKQASESLGTAFKEISMTAKKAANNMNENLREVLKVHTAKRTKLPEDRIGLTRKAQACGMEFYITVNFYPDSVQPAECFCRIAKEGSVVAGFVEALMITISIAFQYSVPWDVLYGKYLHQIFEPRDDENSSLVDAIGKTINGVIKKWETLNVAVSDS
jgi:hypothetical protein